jgi:hypothetical protein
VRLSGKWLKREGASAMRRRGWGLSLSYDDGDCLEQLPLSRELQFQSCLPLLLLSVAVLFAINTLDYLHHHNLLIAPRLLDTALVSIATTSAESTPTPRDEAVNMGAMATGHSSRREQ